MVSCLFHTAGNLTPLGRKMVEFPLDPTLAKVEPPTEHRAHCPAL